MPGTSDQRLQGLKTVLNADSRARCGGDGLGWPPVKHMTSPRQ